MNFKSTIGGVLLSAFFLAGSLASQAATVVWDTGQGVGIGDADLHYTVLGFTDNGPNNSNAAFFATAPSYTAAESGTAYTYSNVGYPGGLTFISSSPGGNTGAPRTTVFQVQFQLDAPSVVSGVWAADNGAVLYANGTFAFGLQTAGNGPDTNWSTPHAFEFTGIAGLNILNFFVTDADQPSGFAFDVQSVVAAAVPGPIVGAGLPGLLMALGSLLILRRRRMLTA